METKTVGELKEYLKNFPDDMLIVKYDKDMERSGYFNDVFFGTDNMEKVTRKTWDRFDHTEYTYETYFESSKENSIRCLVIY